MKGEIITENTPQYSETWILGYTKANAAIQCGQDPATLRRQAEQTAKKTALTYGWIAACEESQSLTTES